MPVRRSSLVIYRQPRFAMVPQNRCAPSMRRTIVLQYSNASVVFSETIRSLGEYTFLIIYFEVRSIFSPACVASTFWASMLWPRCQKVSRSVSLCVTPTCIGFYAAVRISATVLPQVADQIFGRVRQTHAVPLFASPSKNVWRYLEPGSAVGSAGAC